ncbi:unnamed protein product [Rhizophagus irregularis]|nr:unnamed protein product [Rhizophagus irregularis]
MCPYYGKPPWSNTRTVIHVHPIKTSNLRKSDLSRFVPFDSEKTKPELLRIDIEDENDTNFDIQRLHVI